MTVRYVLYLSVSNLLSTRMDRTEVDYKSFLGIWEKIEKIHLHQSHFFSDKKESAKLFQPHFKPAEEK